eukprot:Gb_33742 [translate_table: standard]
MIVLRANKKLFAAANKIFIDEDITWLQVEELKKARAQVNETTKNRNGESFALVKLGYGALLQDETIRGLLLIDARPLRGSLKKTFHCLLELQWSNLDRRWSPCNSHGRSRLAILLTFQPHSACTGTLNNPPQHHITIDFDHTYRNSYQKCISQFLPDFYALPSDLLKTDFLTKILEEATQDSLPHTIHHHTPFYNHGVKEKKNPLPENIEFTVISKGRTSLSDAPLQWCFEPRQPKLKVHTIGEKVIKEEPLEWDLNYLPKKDGQSSKSLKSVPSISGKIKMTLLLKEWSRAKGPHKHILMEGLCKRFNYGHPHGKNKEKVIPSKKPNWYAYFLEAGKVFFLPISKEHIQTMQEIGYIHEMAHEVERRRRDYISTIQTAIEAKEVMSKEMKQIMEPNTGLQKMNVGLQQGACSNLKMEDVFQAVVAHLEFKKRDTFLNMEVAIEMKEPFNIATENLPKILRSICQHGNKLTILKPSVYDNLNGDSPLHIWDFKQAILYKEARGGC